MWNEYFLKAASAAEMLAAMPAEWQVAGQLIDASSSHALIVVGTIYGQTPVDAAGNATAAPLAVAGWHVNVRLPASVALPASLVALQITPPQFPKQVFAAE